MLELRNVDTYYGNIQALRDISLKIEEGEIVTLIGANGAGKSTTLMTICGINRPRNGEILWYGKPIHQLPSHEIVILGISQVPEGRLIFPDLSVSENLDLGAFLRRDPAGVRPGSVAPLPGAVGRGPGPVSERGPPGPANPRRSSSPGRPAWRTRRSAPRGRRRCLRRWPVRAGCGQLEGRSWCRARPLRPTVR